MPTSVRASTPNPDEAHRFGWRSQSITARNCNSAPPTPRYGHRIDNAANSDDDDDDVVGDSLSSCYNIAEEDVMQTATQIETKKWETVQDLSRASESELETFRAPGIVGDDSEAEADEYQDCATILTFDAEPINKASIETILAADNQVEHTDNTVQKDECEVLEVESNRTVLPVSTGVKTEFNRQKICKYVRQKLQQSSYAHDMEIQALQQCINEALNNDSEHSARINQLNATMHDMKETLDILTADMANIRLRFDEFDDRRQQSARTVELMHRHGHGHNGGDGDSEQVSQSAISNFENIDLWPLPTAAQQPLRPHSVDVAAASTKPTTSHPNLDDTKLTLAFEYDLSALNELDRRVKIVGGKLNRVRHSLIHDLLMKQPTFSTHHEYDAETIAIVAQHSFELHNNLYGIMTLLSTIIHGFVDTCMNIGPSFDVTMATTTTMNTRKSPAYVSKQLEILLKHTRDMENTLSGIVDRS